MKSVRFSLPSRLMQFRALSSLSQIANRANLFPKIPTALDRSIFATYYCKCVLRKFHDSTNATSTIQQNSIGRQLPLHIKSKVYSIRKLSTSSSSSSSSSIASSAISALSTLLSSKQKKIIINEKEIFDEILLCLQQLEADPEEIEMIAETKSRVDDVFLVVIVGEFNAGKSTFINALLGEKYLKVGVLPTTSKIGILRSSSSHSSNANSISDNGSSSSNSSNSSNSKNKKYSGNIWKKSEKILLDDVEELDLPVDWLEHIALIDTPGTNAIIERHEALTMKIVPRSDLILFVTSAERPITDSEKTFLMNIQKWGKKVIVIVNKMDLVQSEEDKQQILTFVAQNVGNILGSAIPIRVFGVSSHEALTYKMKASKQGIDPALAVFAGRWLECGIMDIENYLKSILGKEELVRNKLINPLTLVDRVLATQIEKMEAKLISIESDYRLLQTIETINQQFNVDLGRDLELYIGRVRTIMSQVINSTDAFIDANVSISDPKLIMDTERFLDIYSQTVVLDLDKYMNHLCEEICDLLAKKAKEQAHTVLQYLIPRPNSTRNYKSVAILTNNIVQDARIENIKIDLLDQLLIGSKTSIGKYDHMASIERISTDMKKAGLSSTVIAASLTTGGVGALLAQTIVTPEPVTAAVITVASTVIGASNLPRKKQVLRKEVKDRLQILSDQLQANVTNNFTIGSQKLNEVINDGVAPFSRMLRAEKDISTELMAKMSALRIKVREIRSTI